MCNFHYVPKYRVLGIYNPARTIIIYDYMQPKNFSRTSIQLIRIFYLGTSILDPSIVLKADE